MTSAPTTSGTPVTVPSNSSTPLAGMVYGFVRKNGSRPSPERDGSATWFAYISKTTVAPGVPWYCARTVVVLPVTFAVRITGAFVSPFGPSSASPASFGVTPSLPRSIPSPKPVPRSLASIRLDSTELARLVVGPVSPVDPMITPPPLL